MSSWKPRYGFNTFKKILNTIQAYAPTNQLDDQETDEFYEDSIIPNKNVKPQYTLIIQDINAKIAVKIQNTFESST